MSGMDWEFLQTSGIYNNNRVSVPSPVAQNIITEDRIGEVVFSYIQTESNVIVLSESKDLENPMFDFIQKLEIHDQQNSVTFPKDLLDYIYQDLFGYNPEEVYSKGNNAVYIATKYMLDESPLAYFVMASPRFFKLLYEYDNDEDVPTLRLMRQAKPY